jgi:hypothetical protein
VFKRHSVTSDEVDDAYQFYCNAKDAEVLEAASYIKQQAGMFLVTKETCVRLMQVRH